MKSELEKLHILVDLKNFLEFYRYHEVFQKVSPQLGVQELVSMFLSINQHNDYETSLYHLLDKNFQNHQDKLNSINMEIFEFNMEGFVLALDAFIRGKLPQSIDSSQFILDRWINGSMVILKHNETIQPVCASGKNDRYDLKHLSNI